MRGRMATTVLGDLELSSAMLGTVQFGLHYGVANKRGQPSYREVCDILTYAYEAGVNCLDTAPIYGTSEEVLGRAMAELGIGAEMVVASKIYHLANDIGSQVADALVEQSVCASLHRLRLDVLPICLFHVEGNFRFVESLLKLKDRGLVRYIGAACDTTEAAREILDSGLADVIQVPASVLDHRFRRAGVLQAASERGTGLFVRGIYLQGLVLMDQSEIPADLVEALPARRRLRDLAAQTGMGLGELAVRYVLGIDGLTCALVGVESVGQMSQNIELFSRGPLDPQLIQAIDDAVPNLPERILMPRYWSVRMPEVEPLGGSHGTDINGPS